MCILKVGVAEWLKQAEYDLKTSEYNLEGGFAEPAAFWAQQSIEKALKAVALAKSGELRRVHDLSFLGKQVGLPEELLRKCANNFFLY